MVVVYPPRTYSPKQFPPGQFPNLGHFLLAVKETIWKLALGDIPPDPNRSTVINFVHFNGRSFYAADRWMMVVDRGMAYTMQKGGIMLEGKMSGEMCESRRC